MLYGNFTFIKENNLRRECDKNDAIVMIDDDIEGDCDEDDDDDDDDNRSISSENTCSGATKKETQILQKKLQEQSADYEIWHLFQVDDQNLKDIPNSEAILNLLTACNLNGNYVPNMTLCQP